MSRRASPTMIGVFVLGAAAIAVLAVLILAGGRLFERSVPFVMAYSNVAGLQVGAPVLVRGVQVGQVTRIVLRFGSDLIAVYGTFHPDRVEGTPGAATSSEGIAKRVNGLVERGMRAQLATQSFVTGQLYVSLDFHPAMPATYSRVDPNVLEIPTIPTQIALLQDEVRRIVAQFEKLPLQEIAAAAAATLESVGRLARSPELVRAVQSIEPTLRSVQALTQSLDQRIGPVAASLETTVAETRAAIAGISTDARKLILEVDRQVEPLAASLASTSEAARDLVADARKTVQAIDAQVGPLLASVKATSDAARVALESAQSTLARADGVFDESTPLGFELSQALSEFTRAARSLRSLTDELDRQPNVLIFGRGGGQ